MKKSNMCSRCEEEFNDPMNRRFHAQPIACHDCGPQIQLWNSEGKIIAEKDVALEQCIELINQGYLIAIKGLGGFHLVVDSTNDDSVQILRKRKHREEKPLAFMFRDIETVKNFCEVSLLEERLIKSSESPIVLLK